MTKILISAETEQWVTRKRDPSDSWDAGDTEGRVSNVWACVKDDAKEMYYGESKVVELDVNAGGTIYAVVADYSSGSTFGRDGGHAQILDAFSTLQEAETLASAAMHPATSYSFDFNGKSYYKSWDGYFESLNSLDVWTITVRGGPQSFLTPDVQRSVGHRSGI